MDGRVPLSTLLSHALVAFTIEFDNEFEHQMPHRTTNHGSTAGTRHAPWLVSMVMWSNFMQFVGEEGTTIRELQRRLKMSDKNLRSWLARMGEWWGYIVVETKVAGNRSKRTHPDAMVLPTPGGRKAIEIWRTLEGLIENRWRERFGEDLIDHLRETLTAIVSQIDVELPHGLPILGYGLFSSAPEHTQRSVGTAVPAIATLPLAPLLSQALLWFAIEFERDSEMSLAICSNVLRVLTEQGVQVRDLPRLTAVSKEAIAMSLSFLIKRGFAAMKSETTGSRIRMLVLTAKGRSAQGRYRQLMWAIEERWKSRFGEEAVFRLRELLERLEPAALRSPLLRGLEPYSDGWRASIPKFEGLPHYPMVLHRGGFPDGA